jgi:hypothetical protein
MINPSGTGLPPRQHGRRHGKKMDDAVEGESGWRSSDSKTCIWNAIYGDDRYDAIKMHL